MQKYVLVTEREARDPTSARGACYPVLTNGGPMNIKDLSGILTFEFEGHVTRFNHYQADVNVSPTGSKHSPQLYSERRFLNFVVDGHGIIDLIGDRKGYALMKIDETEADRLVQQAKRVQGTWLSAGV